MSDKNNHIGFHSVQETLRKRLKEPPPTLLQILIGPRQVGKTTLLLELATELGSRALYMSADSPEAVLPDWGDLLWKRAKELAILGPSVLFIDEVQTLPHWSRWLKSHFDQILKESLPLHVVVTGSSSLKLGAGSRESMAGRFEQLVLPHWGARDLIELLDVSEDNAAQKIVSFGGYPGAVRFWDDLPRWKNYLQHSIIEPAIGRDILQLEHVRKPALLRQLFAIAAAHPAEILSLEKIAGSLAEKGALETLSHYLELLREAFLVTPIAKYSGSEIRRRKSPPKLVLLNNALLAAGGGGLPPTQETDPERWGRWVENACLAHAINQGENVTYWREEPWEVDGIFIGTHGNWLVEIKTGTYTASDLRGLAQACIKFPKLKPLVLCDPNQEEPAQAVGYTTLPWTDFLKGRWP
ncbi:MAG: hypothetical protein A3F67_02475 [Verrucomicrobia bacterium RIFCSPHIGHO2_12_FULL_41_10]|nr:MAG: hypothetical protein A3F67_02475 [Verrucomicrobia bacterium RIFCSPHIGHO2_12_FULL_41_10]HLB34190.1 ATP-binding protein [Chthoniobacterales bacterium]